MDLTAAEPAARPLSARVEEGSRIAAVDLGTNNCRLLVAELREGELVVVDSFSRIVRLGEGLARTGRLAEAAMARTLSALKVCALIIARNRVAAARCVATEACRRAANGPGFIESIRRVTGLGLEVLSQDEEARLAMLGCLALIDDAAEHLLMLDIGGGSTELLWLDRRVRANGGAPGRTLSLPVGVVTLSESFGPDADAARYAAMVESVTALLDPLGRDWPDLGAVVGAGVQMLGTSGTVTTLAAMHLGLRRYDRRKVDGLRMEFSEVERVAVGLRSLDNQARAANGCIGTGRADLVVAGCAILDAVHRRWPVRQLRVADRGVREGILNMLVGRDLREALLA